MPANYTKKRRIGSIRTDPSANILAFSQNGDEFLWAAPVTDVNVVAPTTGNTAITLTVPTGVIVNALTMWQLVFGNTAGAVDVLSPANGSSFLTGGTSMAVNSAATRSNVTFSLRTNTSAQVNVIANTNMGTSALNESTLGWVDTRGRFN
jgi:hypothetical protein